MAEETKVGDPTKTGEESPSGDTSQPSVEELRLKEENAALKARLGEVNFESKERKEKLRDRDAELLALREKEQAESERVAKEKEAVKLSAMSVEERTETQSNQAIKTIEAMLAEHTAVVEGLVSKVQQSEADTVARVKSAAIGTAIGKHNFHNPDTVRRILAGADIPLQDGQADQGAADKLVDAWVEENKYAVKEKPAGMPDWGGGNPPSLESFPQKPADQQAPGDINKVLIERANAGDKEGAMMLALQREASKGGQRFARIFAKVTRDPQQPPPD